MAASSTLTEQPLRKLEEGGKATVSANPKARPSAPNQKFESAHRKRLIVLCDGTWQDSDGDEWKYPTNVARFGRALNPNAFLSFIPKREANGEEVLEEVEQLVYYQKGIGTGIGDKITGGATGAGLSGNIRSAYGFLANNYDDGDTIYIFGFSRGAYTARCLAGLVVQMGLLTKRGMDNFRIIYNAFFKNASGKLPDSYRETLIKAKQLIYPLPRGTVEIVGVWDTVAFHAGFGGHAEYDFPNSLVSEEYRYAFHALSLDEERATFAPTLWHQRKKSNYVPRPTDRFHGPTELRQVWFCGEHSDIGGGMDDPRLSDIALAWMIAQCSKNSQLSFNDDYLLDPKAKVDGAWKWPTCKGANSGWLQDPNKITSAPGYAAVGLANLVSQATSVRLPGAYYRLPGRYEVEHNKADMVKISKDEVDSHEEIHISLLNRSWEGAKKDEKDAKYWSCQALKGYLNIKDNGSSPLKFAEFLEKEEKYRGKIRKANSGKLNWMTRTLSDLLMY
ncbi:MAG: hypothetical protein M1829_005780 [Trizodia sp. TS-e1964]|nr:MAG: hypothetical protein M1829_005780 [Trizodia sp. TS-e1964]